MKQKLKSGKTYEFESIKERESRLLATAETMFSICKSDSLSISDYERIKMILDGLVYNRTIIHGQS